MKRIFAVLFLLALNLSAQITYNQSKYKWVMYDATKDKYHPTFAKFDSGCVIFDMTGTYPKIELRGPDSTVIFKLFGGTMNFNGRIEQKNKYRYFMAFQDSVRSVSCTESGTWYQVTNAYKNLFTLVDSSGFNYIAGDTIKYTGTNSVKIKFQIHVGGYGATSNRYGFRLFNVTDNAAVPVRSTILTFGSTSTMCTSFIAYDVAANTGDKYILQVRNIASTNVINMTVGSVFAEIVDY